MLIRLENEVKGVCPSNYRSLWRIKSVVYGILL